MRAVRQALADQGINLDDLAREAVEQAVLKKCQSVDVTRIAEKVFGEYLKAQGWDFRSQIASAIANKVSINVQVKS